MSNEVEAIRVSAARIEVKVDLFVEETRAALLRSEDQIKELKKEKAEKDSFALLQKLVYGLMFAFVVGSAGALWAVVPLLAQK